MNLLVFDEVEWKASVSNSSVSQVTAVWVLLAILCVVELLTDAPTKVEPPAGAAHLILPSTAVSTVKTFPF